MKREILNHKRNVSGCCPGHDKFPDDKYRGRLSVKARSRGKAIEHRVARRAAKSLAQPE